MPTLVLPDLEPPAHQPSLATEPPETPPGRHAPRWRGLVGWGLVAAFLASMVWLGMPGDNGPSDGGELIGFLFLLALPVSFFTACCCFLADLGRALSKLPAPWRWGWLKAGMVCGLCLAGASFDFGNDASGGCGSGPNEGFREQVYLTSQRLDSYAAAHDGNYPPSDRWIAELSAEPGYAYGRALQRIEWASAGQTTALSPSALGLPGADAAAALYNLRLHEALPGGQKAHGAPAKADDFGAMLYDMDPKTRTYVLYAIGKHYRHATVAGYFTNADVWALQVGPPLPTATPFELPQPDSTPFAG